MLEMSIMIIFLIVLYVIYFFGKKKYLTVVEINHFASAGSSDYEQNKTIQVKVPNKMVTVSEKEGLTLVKTIGNSAEKTGIKNNNIVAIKMTNNIKDIKKGDVIYLKYNKYPNKFKLREFIGASKDKIFSQTLENGILRDSSHNSSELVGVVKYNTVPL